MIDAEKAQLLAEAYRQDRIKEVMSSPNVQHALNAIDDAARNGFYHVYARSVDKFDKWEIVAIESLGFHVEDVMDLAGPATNEILIKWGII